MGGFSPKFLFLTFGLSTFTLALPGPRAGHAQACSQDANGIYNVPCYFTSSTLAGNDASITPAPSGPVFTPKNLAITGTCGSDAKCTFWDVVSSIVTVVDGSSIAASLSSMRLSTGTGDGRPLPTSAPFGNDTDTNHSSFGPTAGGTAPSSLVIVTQTLNATTVTSNIPQGTGASSGLAVSPTETGPWHNASSAAIHWSAWTDPSTSVATPAPRLVSSTFVSAGQTFTTQVPVSSDEATVADVTSYTTASLVFPDTTILVTIPITRTSGLTNITTPAPATTSPEVTAGPVQSTCYTTTRRISRSGTVTISSADVVCWGYTCDGSSQGVCSDWFTTYTPSNTSTSGPFTNSTSKVAPTFTSPDDISATPILWNPWTSSEDTDTQTDAAGSTPVDAVTTATTVTIQSSTFMLTVTVPESDISSALSSALETATRSTRNSAAYNNTATSTDTASSTVEPARSRAATGQPADTTKNPDSTSTTFDLDAPWNVWTSSPTAVSTDDGPDATSTDAAAPTSTDTSNNDDDDDDEGDEEDENQDEDEDEDESENEGDSPDEPTTTDVQAIWSSMFGSRTATPVSIDSTITKTVSALPATATSAENWYRNVHAENSQNKRARIIEARKAARKAARRGMVGASGLGLEEKRAEGEMMDRSIEQISERGEAGEGMVARVMSYFFH